MPFHFNYEQKYPYTQFEKINLDWVLELATQLKDAAENGDFDGPPGPPGSGTATNGIVFLDNSSTFQDITDAIDEGQLPVYQTFYSGSIPIYYYCFEHGTGWATFIGFHGNNRYLLTWHSDNTKTLATNTWATINSPNFTGLPTVQTPAAGDSSDQIANTQFVQTAVQTAIQNAIQSLVIAPFSENFKQALLQLANKVAYIDNGGSTYYQALYDALYPPINVDHITAVWNPPVGYVVYSTDTLDSLKANLTVTAYYDDNTSAVLDSSEYVLSGTLTAGTSTITVTYAGETTTFNVTVVANALDYITATFTQGTDVFYDTDSLDDLVQDLVVTATYTNLNTVYVDYPNYTLSGTLTPGTSTITVTYEGVTDTFNVTVTVGIVRSGLIHYWDAIDNTGSGHNAAVSQWVDLVGGNTLSANTPSAISWNADAIVFSGVNEQQLTASNNSTKAGGKTIEVVFSVSASQTGTIVTPFHDSTSSTTIKNAYGKINMYSDNTFNVKGMSDTTYTLPSGVNAITDLHSISASFSGDSTVSAVYANAISASKGSVTHSLQSSNAKLTVGASPNNFDYPFTGKIHAIRIYNRVLTASEVQKNYSADAARYSI